MPEDEKEKKLTDRKAKVAAKKFVLGHRDTYTIVSAAGTEREEEYTAVPHCFVGKEPIKEDNYHLCTICEEPMCQAHAIFYENRPYCQNHAGKASDIVKLEGLSLKDAQVLICLNNRIFGPGDISKLARITEDDVYNSLAGLLKSGYIKRASTMMFIKFYELTSDGTEAMPLLYAIHRQKNAMKQFIKEATTWMERKNRVFSAPETEEEEAVGT